MATSSNESDDIDALEPVTFASDDELSSLSLNKADSQKKSNPGPLTFNAGLAGLLGIQNPSSQSINSQTQKIKVNTNPFSSTSSSSTGHVNNTNPFSSNPNGNFKQQSQNKTNQIQSQASQSQRAQLDNELNQSLGQMSLGASELNANQNGPSKSQQSSIANTAPATAASSSNNIVITKQSTNSTTAPIPVLLPAQGQGPANSSSTQQQTSTVTSQSTQSTAKSSSARPGSGANSKSNNRRPKLNQFDFMKKGEMDLQSRDADWRTKAQKNLITLDEVAQHKKRHDCWMVLGGNVYDVTGYMDYHPGGRGELMKGAGKDATQIYNEVHPWVAYDQILKSSFIGKLSHSFQPPKFTSVPNPVSQSSSSSQNGPGHPGQSPKNNTSSNTLGANLLRPNSRGLMPPSARPGSGGLGANSGGLLVGGGVGGGEGVGGGKKSPFVAMSTNTTSNDSPRFGTGPGSQKQVKKSQQIQNHRLAI